MISGFLFAVFWLVLGICFYKFRSSYPSTKIGYRSRLCTMTRETWYEGNDWAGVASIIGGLIVLTLNAIIFMFSLTPIKLYVFVDVFVPLFMVLSTEIRLRQLFKDNGDYKVQL